jgi:hypothetical protein
MLLYVRVFSFKDCKKYELRVIRRFEINDKKPLDVGFPTQISNSAFERQRTGV